MTPPTRTVGYTGVCECPQGLGLVCILLATLTGCSSAETTQSGTPSPSMTNTSLYTPQQLATCSEFFNGLASGDRGGIRAATVLTAPGSAAAVFAQHQLNMLMASESTGGGYSDWSVSTNQAADDVSWVSGTTNEWTSTEQFSGFQFTAAGLLQSRTCNGVPLPQALSDLRRSVSSEGQVLRPTPTPTDAWQRLATFRTRFRLRREPTRTVPHSSNKESSAVNSSSNSDTRL